MLAVMICILVWLLPMCLFFFYLYADPRHLHSFPTRRSSDLRCARVAHPLGNRRRARARGRHHRRSEEHTSELQSRGHLVCRLLLEKKNETASEHAGGARRWRRSHGGISTTEQPRHTIQHTTS